MHCVIVRRAESRLQAFPSRGDLLQREDPMISPDWCRLMAAYNSEMNRRLYAAAAQLPDASRRQDRGPSFGSIHGTLCHLLWADRQWMSRLGGWEPPPPGIPNSPKLIEDFSELRTARD